MSGPGAEMASAASRGHLRASHGDRERVIDLVKAAFVQGRLTRGELDARVGQALASRTYAELATLTADIPAGLIAAPLRRKPAPVRPRPSTHRVVACLILIIPPPALLAAGFLTGNEQVAGVGLVLIPWFFVFWLVAGMQMLANWHDKRSRGQLPSRPAQHGGGLRGEQDGRPGGDPTATALVNDSNRDSNDGCQRQVLTHRVSRLRSAVTTF